MSYKYYPNINNYNFEKKLYSKKEFLNTKADKNINKTMEEACEATIGFQLLNQQLFLKEYLSLDTPYNGILVFHGVGVGKTCAAITIAEGFKNIVQQNNQKILILVGRNIRLGFREKIHSINKNNKNLIEKDIKTQCTGITYSLLNSNSQYLTKKEKTKKIKKMINKYYNFRGYEEFANIISKKTGWKTGKLEDLTPKIIEKIKKNYSNQVIIIDEVHNVKKTSNADKKVPPYLEAVIKYGQNNKLILMSATPMYDKPSEIIFLLNLLLLNDNRKPIKKSDVFDKNNNITKKGTKIIKEKSRGYISFVRGERPPRFPVRIYPKEAKVPKVKYNYKGQIIKKSEQLKYLPIYECPMGKIQFKMYDSILNEENNINNNFGNTIPNENLNSNNSGRKNIVSKLLYASSIVYPAKNGFALNMLGYKKGRGYKNGAFTKIQHKNKSTTYKPTKYALLNQGTKNEKIFLDESLLKKYSSKFWYVLQNIKKSKGIVFIYSLFLSAGGGIIPFAMMLEQNGYTRYCSKGETQLLDYAPNTKKGGGKNIRLDYYTGLPPTDSIHSNEKNRNYREWKEGKYMLLVGSNDYIKTNISDAVSIINSSNNKYGENCKIILGNRVVEEGIDFARIRQVHILEPWYNISRLEQIIGRAIRTCSHKDLKPEERNVEIFFYASIPPIDASSKEKETETIDIRRYRISVTKDIKIKKVERILKEGAVDCFLNKEINYIEPGKVVEMITSSGNKVKYQYGDKPKSRECDYLDNCSYKCNYEPSAKELKNINTDTYNMKIFKIDIDKIKTEIYKLFKKDYVYNISDLLKKIKKNIKKINDILIFRALNEIIQLETTLLDKYKRKGYLIYRNGFYIFQPYELNENRASISRRKTPLKIKTKDIFIPDEYLINFEQNEIKDIKVLEIINKKYREIELLIKRNKIKLNKSILLTMILDNLKNISKENLLQKIIKGETNINKNIIGYFKSNLLKKKTKYIGYEINGKYICYIRNKFIECPLEVESYYRDKKIKINTSDPNHKKVYNNIYGILIPNKQNNYIFKIVDTTKNKSAIRTNTELSRRSISTGRVCLTYDVSNIIDILKNISIKLTTIKIKKDLLCDLVQYIFRLNEHNKVNKVGWFIKKE